jgi:hypothetical protein
VSTVDRRSAVPHAAAPVDTAALALTLLVRVVLALTVVGAVIAALQLSAVFTPAGSSPQPVLRTPYGIVAVGDVTVSVAVDASKGMVGKDAAGEGHAAHTGAASGPAGVRVNVPITLHNQSDAAVRYAPEQFQLFTGDGQPAGPEDSALLTGQLQPGAAVALRLTFALPAGATGTRLVVDGGQPAVGLDLQLPAARTPGQPMTPQDQPAEAEPPAEPAPAPAGAGSAHDPADTSHH